MRDLFTDSGAEFSPCGRYRGLLWRYWDRDKKPLVCILLNPSTATAETDDPTVRRCMIRAQAMGFGGVRVLNIFTLRATDPAELKQVADPVGPGADGYLETGCQGAGMILCGWGGHGTLRGHHRPRCDEVVNLLVGDLGYALHALHLTGAGQPGHPLYLPYSLEPFLWVDPKSYSAEAAEPRRGLI